MASPSVTYTFSNSTTADATQVNQNFTDLINGASDGTKDYSVNALTCAGTATLNGNVNVGNATADDLTITASLASSIGLKTTFTYDIGSATLGLRSIYLGASDSTAHSVRLIGSAIGTSYTITLPTAVPAQANSVMTFSGSGVAAFEPKSQMAVTAVKVANYTATIADDLILVSGASAAWTLTLPASSTSTGKVFTIKRTDNTLANAVTIDANASETIDGALTVTMNTQYEEYTIVCDGSNWHVLDHKTISPWTAYTPTFAGLGTVTTIETYWMRLGDSILIKGKFTCGTTTAATASMTLPTGITIDATKVNSIVLVAPFARGATGGAMGVVLANGNAGGAGTNLLTFGRQDSTTQGLSSALGNAILGTSDPVGFITAPIPASGWGA